jgi:drug/metabolite transporter (DMT)-like permease
MYGVLLAALSGAVASGLGYAVWYRVLPKLNHSVAAVSQLSVPLIAAIGGLIWMAEVFTSRLLISSILVLGGIGVVIYAKNK